MGEANWAGYTYPAILRDEIRLAEAEWDMSQDVNRRAVFWMKVRYWGWWKWVPLPAVLIGSLVGASVGVVCAAIFGW